MPDKLTVDKILNHNLYAKGSINAYNTPNGTVKKTFNSGELIGSVWSWVVRDGDIWYMFYLTPNDYSNFISTWVKDQPNLYLPDAPQILQEIQDKKEQEDIAQNGIVAHLLKKYAPWIVGGVVVAIAAPTLLQSNNKKVNGMTEDQKNLAGLVGTAALIFFLTRKKVHGDTPIVGDPYDGTFPDPVTGELPPITHTDNTGTTNTVTSGAAQYINFIGPFPVSYKPSGLVSGAH
jgi:hypothetical protein